MKKTFLAAVLFSVAPLAWGGTTVVNGATASSSTVAAAVFSTLAGTSGRALFSAAVNLPGAVSGPGGSITTPPVTIDGIGLATITISPDGEVTITPVRRGRRAPGS